MKHLRSGVEETHITGVPITRVSSILKTPKPGVMAAVLETRNPGVHKTLNSGVSKTHASRVPQTPRTGVLKEYVHLQ